MSGSDTQARGTQALQAFTANAPYPVRQIFQGFESPGTIALVNNGLCHARADPTHTLQLGRVCVVDVNGLRGHPDSHSGRHGDDAGLEGELPARGACEGKLPAAGRTGREWRGNSAMQKWIHQGSRHRDDAAQSGWTGPSWRYLERRRHPTPGYGGQRSMRSSTVTSHQSPVNQSTSQPVNQSTSHRSPITNHQRPITDH